jgi:RNAse (barnase) inhibitor barstar
LENQIEKYKQLRDDNIDLGIIAKGFVSLYYNDNVLNYDINLLVKKNYKILELQGKSITDESELLFDLQEKLKLPDYAFKNYDALDACLSDCEIDENGVVIVFRHLNEVGIETIHILLDILANHARRKFASGSKLLTLVQVDNPNFKIIEPIGAINFRLWNDKEWFEGDRRK